MVQLTSDCFAFGGKPTRIDAALATILDSLSIKKDTEETILKKNTRVNGRVKKETKKKF